ncbi:MAG: hypothetical protein G01um101433_1046 [Parcubacteria group bacterium Gr01-1014_33]|nr:MAG: hypothetical protein G01um101433_1046 [Parcubacteria group bacterium Gr01-1014_33]
MQGNREFPDFDEMDFTGMSEETRAIFDERVELLRMAMRYRARIRFRYFRASESIAAPAVIKHERIFLAQWIKDRREFWRENGNVLKRYVSRKNLVAFAQREELYHSARVLALAELEIKSLEELQPRADGLREEERNKYEWMREMRADQAH